MTNGQRFKEVFGFGADGSRIIAVNSDWWDCDFQIRKPKTNADLIRSMTDEELAKWLWFKVGKCPPFDVCPSPSIPCEVKDCWLDWLKQKAEEDK